MANIDRVVVVTVTKTSASVTRQGFGTPLGLFTFSSTIQSTRYATYSSTQELVDAGFATTDPVFLWGQTVLGQEFSPLQISVGRRDDTGGTIQVDTVDITAADAGVWSITIDTVVYSFTATASDTTTTIAEGLRAAVDADVTNSVVVPTTTTVGVFTVSAFVIGEAFVNGGIILGGAGTGTFVSTTPNAAPTESVTDAILAVQAENDEWYQLNSEARQNTTDQLALNTYVAGQMKILVLQSAQATFLAGTVGNIGDLLGATNNKRTQIRYYSRNKLFNDGAMTGRSAAFDLDATDGAGTWALKQLQITPVDDLTTAEIDNIEANNGDVFISIGGRGATLNGKSVEGEFMDVQTTLDWTASRTQEDVFAVLATTSTKVPYTDEGIALVTTAVLGVLTRGVANGHFSPDDPTLPKVTAPRSVDVPVADKNDRILRNVVGEAILAGAIHEARIQVNVSA